MSVRIMTAVWDHAQVNGSTLVVLLAMADWADDNGLGVFPKQETLAAKARMSKRNVSYVLDELEAAGYIERVGKRAGGVIDWRVETDVAKIAGLQSVASQGCSGLQTDPSIDPPEESKDSSSAETNDSLSEPEQGDGSGPNTTVPPPPADRYADPQSKGAAAAPWLVLELARLMRENDEKVKLPVGIRTLMAPEYTQHYTRGFRSLEKRRELINPVVGKPAVRNWLDSMRLLIDTDERDEREVACVLRWCQADSFWKGNILSADKFRKQYGKLRARWLEEGGGAAARPKPRPGDRGPATAAQLDALAGRRGTE